MIIQKLSLRSLKPNPDNPREDIQPGHPVYESLKKSIQNHDCVQPLVWNKRSGFIIGGNQRLKVLKDLGYEEIEVVVVDLSPEQERTLNIALNKIQADWDTDKLAVILSDLSKLPDFDFAEIGFDLPEVSEILDAHGLPDAEDDFDVESAVEAITEPITKPGELIQLNGHRILCGDSSDPKNYEILMCGHKAHQCDTDCPYNVNYLGGHRPNPNTRPKKSRNWDRIYSDNMPQDQYEEWMRRVLENIKASLHPGAAIYIWQGHRQFPPMYQILLDLGFHVACVIAWIKESAAISYADYSFRSEQCLYGWLEGAAHYFAGAPSECNVWEIKRDPTKTYQHPTQKPVALRQRSVKNSSKRGDIVLDVFLGSGSLLLACESLGRLCYGIELDPKYCDVAVRRFLNFVGQEKAPQDLWDRYMGGVTHGK